MILGPAHHHQQQQQQIGKVAYWRALSFSSSTDGKGAKSQSADTRDTFTTSLKLWRELQGSSSF